MKRQRQTSEGSAKGENVPVALAAYGEQFMSMFDDYDEQAAKKQEHAGSQLSSDSEPSSKDTGSSHSSDEQSDDGLEERRASHKHAGPSATATGTPASRLEAFLSGRKGLGSAAVRKQPSNKELTEQQKQLQQQRLLERKLKKQFMSSKVSQIFNDVNVSALMVQQQQGEEGDLTREEFVQMMREVEKLGASGLDKRSAKSWKASMLARLGAAAEKGPRTGAKIGLGMAKKAKQREAVALQEAIAAGMVKAKGRGKKIRAEKAKQRDKGLMEAGPGFKNGVLRLGNKFAR